MFSLYTPNSCKMKLDILICTYNDGIGRCHDILLPENKNICYKISHQIQDSKYANIPPELKNRKDVEISQISSTGLSNNRNNVISMARGDICIIADDDVRFEINGLMSILDCFSKNDNIDIIAGKIKTYPGEGEYKKYKKKNHRIKTFHIGSISSIEIAFRRNSIIDNHIKFDNRFGLKGSLYMKGEESIFLKDAIDASLRIYYYPTYFVIHHKESSCSNINYDSKEAEYLGALNWRLFKKLSLITMFVFTIKHYSRYINNISPISFIKAYMHGVGRIKSRQESIHLKEH